MIFKENLKVIFFLKIIGFLLFINLLTGTGTTQSEGNFLRNKQDQIFLQDEIKNFILSNPEIIIQAIELFREQQETAKVKEEERILRSKSEDIYSDGYSFVGGNKDGAISIVAFIDYKCGYCRKNHQIIWDFVDANADVRFVLKEFPILGNESYLAAKALAGIALKDSPTVYRKLSDQLMKFTGKVSLESLEKLAKQSGSTVIQLESIMNSEEVTDIIDKNIDLATALNIQGTPTFIIQDVIIRGFISKDELEDLIDMIRKRL